VSYVIAAYGITVVVLVGYGIHLIRELARLRNSRK
jgi:heme exporter protein D